MTASSFYRARREAFLSCLRRDAGTTATAAHARSLIDCAYDMWENEDLDDISIVARSVGWVGTVEEDWEIEALGDAIAEVLAARDQGSGIFTMANDDVNALALSMDRIIVSAMPSDWAFFQGALRDMMKQ